MKKNIFETLSPMFTLKLTGVKPAGHGQIPGSYHFYHRPWELNIQGLGHSHIPEEQRADMYTGKSDRQLN